MLSHIQNLYEENLKNKTLERQKNLEQMKRYTIFLDKTQHQNMFFALG